MASNAEAIHMTNGEQHIVGLKSLRVLLSKDDGSWFAQGLEIDYAAAGETLVEAKKNFEQGLSQTIAEHLKLHGTIERFLTPAPALAWADFYAAQPSSKKIFNALVCHNLSEEDDSDLDEELTSFPFGEIEFLVEQLAA